ncbi:MAG TPA: cytochrome c oxidase subunit 4 [Candidatus Limnocylindria bacterium]
MAEELRFFLRTALYSAAIGIIYWFASYDAVHGAYDWIGTVMLAAAGLASGAVVVVMALFARRALEGAPGASTLGVVARWLGFTDPGGPAGQQPLAAGLEPLPRRSAWPLVSSLAVALIGLGIVFGPWLLLPGIVLLAGSVWGWVTQLQVPR